MKVEQAARDFDLRQRESKYAVVARDFVSHATTKDTERMLRLTSKFMIKNDGQGLTRRNYMERVIPYFQGVRVEWNEESKIVSDDKGNRGFAFFGKISGRSSQFSTTVMRESGTIKIINIITE